MDAIREALEGLPYAGSSWAGISLSQLFKAATGRSASKRKTTEIVNILYKFYTTPNIGERLYTSLNEYEKDILTSIVNNNYSPLGDELEMIADEHNFKPIENSFNFKEMYFPKGSKLYAFFIGDRFVAPFIKQYLQNAIPKHRRAFKACKIDSEDDYTQIIGREDRYRDFDLLVSFIKSNKVAATKTGAFNKAAAIKFINEAGFEEPCHSSTGKAEDIQNFGETIVSYGMLQLLRCANVVTIEDGKFELAKNALDFLAMELPQKASFLLDAYTSAQNDIIDECKRISVAGALFPGNYTLYEPRQTIISLLSECPVNEWISFTQLAVELYRISPHLFDAGMLDVPYGSFNWRYSEPAVASKVLMEYLATLGVVDILAHETTQSYTNNNVAYKTAYFRLTSLGAYLFGVTDKYEDNSPFEKNEATGFIVQPNYEVIIPDGKERMRHEFYFSQFATRVVSDKQACIFKLDFKGIAKALSQGLGIRDIYEYCCRYASVPVPDIIKRAFSEWEAASKKIRIRTVTILEADDLYLLEELRNYKGMDAMSDGEMWPSVVIDKNNAEQVRKLIEKNNRFCSFE
ncbi:MAG: hypothetical protein FWG10_12875 [Eubacteriaceae bacterium]|nr:hypothetical protein [Eubacteriaceae bacterium]